MMPEYSPGVEPATNVVDLVLPAFPLSPDGCADIEMAAPWAG
jgi:hypothetical protein